VSTLAVIDTSLAGTSNDLVTAAVFLYALAMLGYAAEFAFGRRARRTPLVVHAATALDAIPATATEPHVVGSPPRTGSRGVLLGRLAVVLTVAGWAAHLGSVVTRGLAAHRVPWGNMYEFSSMVTLAGSTAYLVLLLNPRLRPLVRPLGAFVMVPVVLTLGLGTTVLYAKAEPLQPALQDYWIKIHVVAAIIAWGTFMVGAVASALYLVKSRYEARVATVAGGTQDESTSSGILRRVPSAADLDRLAYRVNAFAFPIWTFAIVAGAIWAERAWGRYWGWDPKETWSFITWVVYAAYLHARATAGWKGKRAAYLALLAFSCLTFDYYVVNIFVVGLHSYAGL
jgi:cytochrome c-type biogenesis protein CcsB